jgi:SAM-dependent methyltransferase
VTGHAAPDAGAAGTTPGAAAEYWENRYRERGRTWSGAANAALVREISGMAPGTALDVGSGEGGDALWLAHNGWSVTAVDISPTALAVGESEMEPGDDITWVAADLAEWIPPTTYDLVTSHFLHSTVDLPREDILRRAAAAVAPGGTLLIVGHAGAPHWAEHTHTDVDLPTPSELLTALDLAPAEWTVQTEALVDRPIVAPDGSPSSIADSVLRLRRTPARD